VNELLTIEQANTLIDRGLVLHIAGDERALRQLHRGTWIGGTTPYLLTRDGGIVEREKVFVTELPVSPRTVTTRFVDIGHIPAISTEAPRNGFSIVICPAMSEIHTIYSLTSANVPGIRDIALMGWIAGVHGEDRHTLTPKVFDGVSGEAADDRIVVLRAALPPDKEASVGIVNLVTPGEGDEFIFHETAFSVKECVINGQPDDLYDYALRNNLGIYRPLVTELKGEYISASFKLIDAETRSVQFYAPLMRGRTYRLAAVQPDYRAELVRFAEQEKLTPVLSINCVLNFSYGGMQGEHFNPLPGPAVFGELAHVLMNQTLVCLLIKDK
jgi:hypothetical protein